MNYLVQMKLVASGRPINAGDGPAFIEQYILPTLELCRKLESEKKILAGGPISGTIGIVLLVQAKSARELDDLLTSLPVWPRMETEVTALTTFADREATVRTMLAEYHARMQKAA